MSPSNFALVVLAVALVVVSFIALKAMRSTSTPAEINTQELAQHIQAATNAALNQATDQLARGNEARMQSADQQAALQQRQSLEQVQQALKPVKEVVEALNSKVAELEKERVESFTRLTEQMNTADSAIKALHLQTGGLEKALTRSDTRGRWGEMQLRRLIEMIGLAEHVSFVEQKQQVGEGSGRPDVTVYLPHDQVLYIDSKMPFDEYYLAVNATDPVQRIQHMENHADAVQKHIKDLSAKKYYDDEQSLDYVVMYVDLESALIEACVIRPSLLEDAAKLKILITSPTTLMAMLSSFGRSWQHVKQEKNTQELMAQVQELHKRLKAMFGHIGKTRKSLEDAVKSYNQMVSSLDRNVMTQIDRVENLMAKSSVDRIPSTEPIDELPQSSTKLPELDI